MVGIAGDLLNWIEDTTDRKQRVQLNGCKSDWIDVTSGVPQGSVLGQLLFLIYVNDMDVSLDVDISKFADYTKLGLSISNESDVSVLQANLNRVLSWCKNWGMSLNPLKCKVIRYGRGVINHLYVVDGVALEVVDEIKDLGVIVDAELKFTGHCTKVVNNEFRTLGYINRVVMSKKE